MKKESAYSSVVTNQVDGEVGGLQALIESSKSIDVADSIIDKVLHKVAHI